MQPTRKGDEYFSKANVWDMVNSMLCSWILDILDPKLHMSIGIAYPKTTYGMSNDLKKLYSIANAPKNSPTKGANCKL